ncbi:3'-5' exonuclease [Isoalcanivorax pacificus]|nr:3'-5' exonuclease [Isoalcanivorax pacificus]
MYKVIQTRGLNKCFRVLSKSGKKGKDAITKVRAALAEAGTEGSIFSLKRTNHGESRLKNIEKYDLGGGYRLVVQLVDGKENVRAFLFAGDHDDCEQWLESHKDYEWVKSSKDQTLDFVQVSEKEPRSVRVVNPDIDSAEELRALPLLRHLESVDMESLQLHDNLVDYVMGVTPEDWECDSSGILSHIESIGGIERAIFFDDLFSHSHKGELSELKKRVTLELGEAVISDGADLAKSIVEPQNSEIFVTWEEVATLPDDSSWADWLLFLHPEQKALSLKEFRGASRLRGVSGSGKTCVMLHRARHLAKKYRAPILLVTLTESMRKLLDSLIKELCGVESSFIQTSTINGLAKYILKELHPKGEAAYRVADGALADGISRDLVKFVKNHDNFMQTKLSILDYADLRRFCDEEVFHIRSRLKFSEFDSYLDTQSFKRHGRVVGLPAEGRKVFLDAARYKVDALKKLFVLDYEGVVSAAISLLVKDMDSLESFGWAAVDADALEGALSSFFPYRCVLVDEVQDLSQLEVAMIGALPVASGNRIANSENGLFLVGDGAQTIYNKGFALKNCGISVNNRSYVLKKNYRNSKEIMSAAYSLIKKYKFADVDEDNIDTPTKPDFATKVGERPYVVKCRSEEDEVALVSAMIRGLIDEHQSREETEDYPELCVIGLNPAIRRKISGRLNELSIKAAELKQAAGVESFNSVAISTIESAKGHEFRHVFIVGVVDGAMPSKYAGADEMAREASRLYVAMTRARERLIISYNVDRQNQPSRFLIDIQDCCDEYEWSSGQIKVME